MAQISLNLNYQTFVSVTKFDTANPCVGIYLETNLPPIHPEGRPIPFARDSVMLHGDESQLRGLAEKIIAALPPVE